SLVAEVGPPRRLPSFPTRRSSDLAGVRQLEEQMGVLLVNRASRFQGFTPEGQRVLEWARRIVGDARSMREEINSLRHGLSGRLRSEEHTSELQSRENLVCRLLLEK